jgi:hypothetical protein
VLRAGRSPIGRLRLSAGSPVSRLSGAVFASLVLASFAAFFVTQRLKHTPTIVQRFMRIPYFSPTPAGRHKRERISFRIKDDDEVTVSIVDSAGDEVATLVRDHPLERYHQFRLSWNGRRGANTGGPTAPAGEYRVRVSLRREKRSVLSPDSFTLVLTPRHPHTSLAPTPSRSSSSSIHSTR